VPGARWLQVLVNITGGEDAQGLGRSESASVRNLRSLEPVQEPHPREHSENEVNDDAEPKRFRFFGTVCTSSTPWTYSKIYRTQGQQNEDGTDPEEGVFRGKVGR
jgi:hypothetical protein